MIKKRYTTPEIFLIETEDILLISSLDFEDTVYYGTYYGYRKDNGDDGFAEGDFEVSADDFVG